jgi:hypothetical protein
VGSILMTTTPCDIPLLPLVLSGTASLDGMNA